MFLSQLANSTVVIMNLVTGTKYSGISQILATNHKNIKISEMTRWEKKRIGSNYIAQAADRCLFTGAIPLLIDTGTFACCVSAPPVIQLLGNQSWWTV
jgi:hypothetical protein